MARRWRNLRLRRGLLFWVPVAPLQPLPGGQIVSAVPAVARPALTVPGLLIVPSLVPPPPSFQVARSVSTVTDPRDGTRSVS